MELQKINEFILAHKEWGFGFIGFIVGYILLFTLRFFKSKKNNIDNSDIKMENNANVDNMVHILTNIVDEKQIVLEERESRLQEIVKKFNDLTVSLKNRPPKESLAKKAGKMLLKGAFQKAEELLLESSKGKPRIITGQRHSAAQDSFDLGLLKDIQLNYQESEKFFRQAVELDPKNTSYLSALGSMLFRLEDYATAAKYHEQALVIDLKELGKSHPDVAADYTNLGKSMDKKGMPNKAVKCFEKSYEINLAVLGNNHPAVAADYSNLGTALCHNGEHDQAIVYHEKSLKIKFDLFMELHPLVAEDYINLGMAYWCNGEYDKAITYYEKSLQIKLKIFGENHPLVAMDCTKLGLAWWQNGNYERAIEYYQRSLQIKLQRVDEQHPDVVKDYRNLGTAWQHKGAFDLAIEYHEKALVIHLKILGDDNQEVAQDCTSLGVACDSKKEYNKAAEYYKRALVIFKKNLPPNDPHITIAENNLNQVVARKKAQAAG